MNANNEHKDVEQRLNDLEKRMDSHDKKWKLIKKVITIIGTDPCL